MITLRLLVLLVGLGLAGLVGKADARSVFILYDTSGSMDDRRFLPAFGAAMLGATLDGRAGHDRLFTMTFEDYRNAIATIGQGDGLRITADTAGRIAGQLGRPAYRPETMTSLALQSRATADMNRRFSTTGKGTPYGSIELMLDAIARETQAGEEAHLIVVSDGAFQAEPAPPAVRASIREHRARIKADLRVSFLLILPARPGSESDARTLLRNVDDQNIRASLLSEFNGDPDDGSYTVNSGPALWAALQDIIARIAATDRTELGRYVAYQGNEIRIDSPFSISRIIAVATDDRGAPPGFVSSSFGAAPDSIELQMLGRDAEFPGIAFRGASHRFRFTPGLPPGQHGLAFDAPVEGRVFLLFDTDVFAAVDILDAQTGQPAPRDGEGRAVLEQGGAYLLQTVLSDPGSTAVTDFARLAPTTVFTVEIEGPSGPSAVTLVRDDPANRAVAALGADDLGRFRATAQVRIPGFVSPKSVPLDFTVIDRRLVLSLAAERPAEACPDCAPGQLRSSVVAQETETEIVTYDIAVEGQMPGNVRVDLTGSAGFLQIFDAAGAEIVSGSEIRAVPGTPITLTLRRRALDAAALAAIGRPQFSLALTPGSGTPLVLDRTVATAVPPARLTLVGYAKGSPQDGPMAIADGELLDGDIRADLRIEDALLAPDAAAVTVRADGLGWFWTPRLTVSGDLVGVAPQAGILALAWIEAAAQLRGRKVDAIVRYADGLGLQSAEARVPMTFDIGLRAFLISLALNLLVLLAVLYALCVFFAIFAVRRFPRHSVAELRYPSDETVRRRALRGSWTIYLGVLLVPFRRPPRERKIVGDLHFASAPGGVELLLPKTGAPRWLLASRAMTLAKMRELSPSLASVRLNWGDSFQSEDDPEQTITLLRDRRRPR